MLSRAGILENKSFLTLLDRHGVSMDSAIETPGLATIKVHKIDEIYTTASSIPNHINTSNCFDETGVECLLNHDHLPAHSKLDLLHVFGHVAKLKRSLEEEYSRAQFRIIASFRDDEAIIRFHKVRVGQEWANLFSLDDYLEEAILVITVGLEPDAPSPVTPLTR